MEHNNTVSLQFTQEDLVIVHRALCDYRSKLGNLMSQMAGLGLSTEEAQMLSKMCIRYSSPASSVFQCTPWCTGAWWDRLPAPCQIHRG